MVISPSLLLDSPLPDGRLPNGGSMNGPSGRQNYWGSTNWSNLPAGGTIAGLGKPPLGRDPKSRARSRDYLKQYVVLASHIFSPQCIAPSLQMPPRNKLSHVSSSYESSAQSTSNH